MTTVATPDVDRRLDDLTELVESLVEEAEERRQFKESYSDLINDLTPIASQGMDSLTRVMIEAENRGYIDFAKSGLGVVERVVTSFSEEDVEALGDNIVLILETVKEMTQPEIMQMMQSTFHTVHDLDEETTEPPGMFAILGQMRDPEVRRGLNKMIVALKGMGHISENTQTRKEARQ
jgi:uncharacterized protein YjgD (DUF1641 family)